MLPFPDMGQQDLIEALQGEDLLSSEISQLFASDTAHPKLALEHATKRPLRLYISEEQPVLQEAFRSFFTSHASFEISGFAEEFTDEALGAAIALQKPDVLLLGLKTVEMGGGEKLKLLRKAAPECGLVLLFALHDATGIGPLREFAEGASAGYAYLLKHNLYTTEQLAQVIQAVGQGRVIVDPLIMEDLVDSATSGSRVLTALSPTELEILSWMARGYADKAIAGVLSRDVKTLERQINHIYSKLDTGEGLDDRRVGAALMYLKATGLLPRA